MRTSNQSLWDAYTMVVQEYGKETVLHAIPVEAFLTGGSIAVLLQKGGYTQGATATIGEISAWEWSVKELGSFLDNQRGL